MIASRSGGIESRAQRMASRSASARSMPIATAPRTIWVSCLANRVGISGAWASIDIAAVVVLDAGAGQGDQVGGGQQVFGFVVGDRDRLGVHAGDHAGDRRGELGAHLRLGAGVADRVRPAAMPAYGRVDADQDEPVAHGGDDGVVGVPGGGDGTDDDDAPLPADGPSTVGADLADQRPS